MNTEYPRRGLELKASAGVAEGQLPLVMATDVMDDMRNGLSRTEYPRRGLELKASAGAAKEHLPLVMPTDVVDDMRSRHSHTEHLLKESRWRVCCTTVPAVY